MTETELIDYLEQRIKEMIPDLEVTSVQKKVMIDEKRRVDLAIQTKDDIIMYINVKSSGEPSKYY